MLAIRKRSQFRWATSLNLSQEMPGLSEGFRKDNKNV
jgi:hypothetical protein